MKGPTELHTVPLADGRRWGNRLGGALITRHRHREDALAAGVVIAQSLGVEHVIHDEGDAADTSTGGEPPG